jgi:hypothetical protein
LGKQGGTGLFRDREEQWEAGHELRDFRRILSEHNRGQDAGATFAGVVLGSLVEALLEAGDVNVEAEYLSREGMFGGKILSPANSLLPLGLGHEAIMGLGRGPRQLGSKIFIQP